MQTLAETGPSLIDLFLSGAALARQGRVTATLPAAADILKQLSARSERSNSGLDNLNQPQLFEQYNQVLRSLAAQQPLLLLLDDLQWADTASINLLFHLGRRLINSRILILGAYRPSEVAVMRPTGNGAAPSHPLLPVVTELKRHFGPIQLDLEQVSPAEGRAF